MLKRVMIAAALVWISVAVSGQSNDAAREWPTYGGDLGNTRYSPLNQINAGNFSTLEVAWRFKTDNLGPRPEYKFESTPLMVNGAAVLDRGDAPRGGRARCRDRRTAVDAQRARRRARASRASTAVGPRAGVLERRQAGAHSLCDARLSPRRARCPHRSAGHRLRIERHRRLEARISISRSIPITAPVGLHATPLVANDVVIVGAAFETGANPSSKTNVKGYIRGFDARTGKRLWIFHTVPQRGEFGYDTWLEDSASYTGNTGVWAQMSADPELGLAYLPTELPTHDYYGGFRPGNNLFSESIVAVDLRTGQRKWHYQLVHHGIWDMDIPAPPILADITVNGRAIKALAQPTKQAFLYVLDRATGEPVWPIEERPVPKGDTPREWYSPTQPFPTKPPAYDGQGLAIDDLIDFTPELRAEAVKLVSRYRLGPIFTPPAVSRAEGPIATLTMGAQAAATNWPGGSYDPETHTVFVASQTAVATLGLMPAPPGRSDLPYFQGTVLSGARLTGGAGSDATATACAIGVGTAECQPDRSGAAARSSRRTAGSPRSISTRARSGGRCRSAPRPRTFAITRR